MSGAEIVVALGSILSGLSTLSRAREGRRAVRTEAIRRLSAAVTATRSYLRNQQSHPDHDIEASLTDHWFQAANALDSVDGELAELCRIKGHYWTDPDAWSAEDIAEARIALANMTTQLDRLLLS